MLDELQVKFTMSQGRNMRLLFPHISLTDGLIVVKCLFRQLLEGLDYLHRNEVIHRYDSEALATDRYLTSF